MGRREFTMDVKRAALKRAKKICEAVGILYGLPPGVRCSNKFTEKGLQFDHVLADALDGDNGLENCAAVCIPCHKYKTGKSDVPRIRKADRQRDLMDGLKGHSWRWGRRPMGGRSAPRVRDINDDLREGGDV